MKTLISVLLLLLLPCCASAQTWHTTNQVTLAWDAVTLLDNGQPVPATDTVKYQTYVKFQNADAAPVAIGSETALTQQAIAFSSEGRYYLCVDAVRYIPNEPEGQRSGLSCSHDGAVTATGTPFGVKYFNKPGGPNRLRIQ